MYTGVQEIIKSATAFEVNATDATLATYFRSIDAYEVKTKGRMTDIRKEVINQVREWLDEAKHLKADEYISALNGLYDKRKHTTWEYLGRVQYKNLLSQYDDLAKVTWKPVAMDRVNKFMNMQDDILKQYKIWRGKHLVNAEELVEALMEIKSDDPGYLDLFEYDDELVPLVKKRHYEAFINNLMFVRQYNRLALLLQQNKTTCQTEEGCHDEEGFLTMVKEAKNLPIQDTKRLKQLASNIPYNADNTKELIGIWNDTPYEQMNERLICWKKGDQTEKKRLVRTAIQTPERKSKFVEYVVMNDITRART